MITSKQLIESASLHIGEKYILGSLVPMNNANWKGPWDCAEFITYIVYRLTNVLYGFRHNESYTGYWGEDVDTNKVITIPVNEAVQTEGAILLRRPQLNMRGHIALSNGKGGTVEARGKAFGVCAHVALGANGANTRAWNAGILIPTIAYTERLINTGLLADTILPDAKNVEPASKELVCKIQYSLAAKGFYSQKENGAMDDDTTISIYNYQLHKDLEPSGILDDETLKSLL